MITVENFRSCFISENRLFSCSSDKKQPAARHFRSANRGDQAENVCASFSETKHSLGVNEEKDSLMMEKKKYFEKN